MTHTSSRFTPDSYDQSWSYEKKHQFVQGTDPWGLEIPELKKVITDLDLIKEVSKPRSFYAAMKSESKQLWRYAEALEKKTKMNVQQTFRWGLRSDPRPWFTTNRTKRGHRNPTGSFLVFFFATI